MKLSEYAARERIGYRAAWDRFRKGRIDGAYLDDSGHAVVPHPQSVRLSKAVVYARVSSHPQKDDLDRQAERLVQYANARGLQVVSVVKEIASGVNDSRPKLTALLGDGQWGTIVVEHRDRLARVGFGWFDTFLTAQGRVIDVANPAEEDGTDLMEDFLAIIYSFAARMYGRRGAKSRARSALLALSVAS
jgi:predicted site-specific integrase-resolvase